MYVLESLQGHPFALRKKCLHSELFWSAFSPVWTEYGEIRSISAYFVRMRKNTDENHSEYGHFSRGVGSHFFMPYLKTSRD